jgi:LacI family transcriptional regulator, trehalose operon repressor
MNKKATITDVARLAGVGKTTVSRVFNNRELVNAETVDRVMEGSQGAWL